MNHHSWSCRYFSFKDCGVHGSPEATAREWLSDEEHDQLRRLRSVDCRRAWVAGRVAAKRALQRCRLLTNVPPQAVTVRSRDAAGRHTWPRIFVRETEQPLSLSISHLTNGVLIGLAQTGGIRIGVDLAASEKLGRGFRHLWFTPRERHLLQSRGRFSAAAVWALKEAAYKSLQSDRAFAPRQFEIRQTVDGGWCCCVQDELRPPALRVYCWHVENFIAAVAIRPARPTLYSRPATPGIQLPSLTAAL